MFYPTAAILLFLGVSLRFGPTWSFPQVPDLNDVLEDWALEDWPLLPVPNKAQDFQSCGRRNGRNGRVIGGHTAQIGEFPWMVSIQKSKEHICGGVLIADQWVLTAAHCVDEISWLGKKSFSVLLGSSNLHHLSQSASRIAIAKVVSHPEFRMSEHFNDIALIKLAEPVHMDDNKHAICLPPNDIKLFEHASVELAGWGQTSDTSGQATYSPDLNKVGLKLVKNKDCRDWFKRYLENHVIPKTLICAGFRNGGKDSCYGDSGGPLMMKQGNRFTVVGIVSSGVGCGRPDLPGLYTNVKRFTSWIYANMK